jgi:hypothetical protein
MPGDARSVDWLRLIRLLTQYIAPCLVALVMLGELLGAPLIGSSLTGSNSVYNYLLVTAFTVLTVAMIVICGWTVFLRDIDRLFFKLENKIDAEIGELDTHPPNREQDGSLLSRAREMLNSAVQTVRAKSVALIEKAYWDDINAGGVLAFPQPDIAAAVEQIDKSRRDLLTPLTELVASAIPLGNLASVLLYQVDLMLRGALFDFMEHTHRSVSSIAINQNGHRLLSITHFFSACSSIYVISSVFRVTRFVFRRWRPLLRR